MSPFNADASVPVPRGGIELTPEIVLPTQFDAIRGTAVHLPEHRLMLAVLEDAVHAYQVGCGARDVVWRRRFHETDAWFTSDDTSSPFSFVTICLVVGLDPDFLRGGLRRWRARQEADGHAGSPTTFRFRRVSGSRHRVTMSRRGSSSRR